ncbi:MAG: sigma factor-like helix-turn-helix DNA-binding protein [Acidimicrobiales bacterium]
MNEHTPEAEPTMAIADATQVGFDADADTGSQTAIRSFDEFYRSHRHRGSHPGPDPRRRGPRPGGCRRGDVASARALVDGLGLRQSRRLGVPHRPQLVAVVAATASPRTREGPSRRLPATTFDRPVDTDLARAITRLSDDHRAVVVLRFYRDWSVEETADALDIAPGTVKSRLSRALDQLQHHLTNLDDEGPLR